MVVGELMGELYLLTSVVLQCGILSPTIAAMKNHMTHDQFEAVAKLKRLRSGPTMDAARYHLVYGMQIAHAAEVAGARYDTTYRMIRNVLADMHTVKVAAGMA